MGKDVSKEEALGSAVSCLLVILGLLAWGGWWLFWGHPQAARYDRVHVGARIARVSYMACMIWNNDPFAWENVTITLNKEPDLQGQVGIRDCYHAFAERVPAKSPVTCDLEDFLKSDGSRIDPQSFRVLTITVSYDTKYGSKSSVFEAPFPLSPYYAPSPPPAPPSPPPAPRNPWSYSWGYGYAPSLGDLRPVRGCVFLWTSISIANVGQTERSVTWRDWEVICSHRDVYGPVYIPPEPLGARLLRARLLPGGTAVGYVVFVVPQSENGLRPLGLRLSE